MTSGNRWIFVGRYWIPISPYAWRTRGSNDGRRTAPWRVLVKRQMEVALGGPNPGSNGWRNFSMESNLIISTGPFEARYLAFLETIAQLRPRLHRYCSRMTGSVLDGEDLVQDALFEAYRKLDQFDERRPLAPWLFRIAHNRCIDFLRRRSPRDVAEASAAGPDSVPAAVPASLGIGPAIERLVLMLPPKERASVLLKEVLGLYIAGKIRLHPWPLLARF